ncbi:MAG: hypothetical protein GX774_09610 [Armatimonadetes bacterium]|jgi:Tfp pilus assembly protein PilV|nr:hypothetical protein [Armatimonadota bacterium]
MAISVIAVGLLGIFQVLSTTLGTNIDARNRTCATRFAQQELEAVRNTPFSALSSQAARKSSELTAGLGGSAEWDLQVTPLSDTLKGVTVVVRWMHQGQPQQVALSTLAHSAGIASIRNQ